MNDAKKAMRINKYLADHGFATRRGADLLIERGAVSINGHTATLGDRVREGDAVEVKEEMLQNNLVYYAYHKPRGTITQHPENGEREIADDLSPAQRREGVFPVGRLDKASRGLIILTNDGRVTARLLHPEYDHEKEYEVRTRERMRESFTDHLQKGVRIEGYTTKPCLAERLDDYTFTITLTEGKKHQIRRMVVALHNQVSDLKRTRVLTVRLRNLKEGATRPIVGEELRTFLSALNLSHRPSSKPHEGNIERAEKRTPANKPQVRTKRLGEQSTKKQPKTHHRNLKNTNLPPRKRKV